MNKKIIIFLFSFFTAAVIADRIGGLAVESVYQKVKLGQSGGKINHYFSLEQTPDLLVLGNSRSYYHVNPSLISSNGYNLSHAGMDDSFQVGLLNILLQENKVPDSILLHIEPEFYMDQRTSRDIMRLKYFYSSNDRVKYYLDELDNTHGVKQFFSLYKFNGIIINIVKNYFDTRNHNFKLENGYQGHEPTLLDSLQTERTAANRGFPDAEIVESQFRFLKEIVTLCHSNNIRLVCFTSPYYRKIDTTNLTKVWRKLETVLSESGVEYVNLSKEPAPKLHSPKLWKDAFHLNKLGAEKLTIEINQRLNNVRF